ncbi:MAG: hypothetical protein AAGF96_05970 [Bacteroidota bacterium]
MAKKKVIEYSGQLKAGKRLTINNERYDVVNETQLKVVRTNELVDVKKPDPKI